ncbi:type VII toxin-antitoxin system MntA family adenylyltransferase antitoxin [Methylococcus mesophilus]|uniref:type VII toxin-antitoxin system MntA family adenylyltransferase antitoxin n=1 Tax=Methylococcus mesophilus TaxID=2993564 RepID=UPI00224A56CE|nr:nucleotidyltransferase domain-containing protein [Methylococcus mesophilus]UZR29217.1 nucleotidyltransferase domain-containing protein [Methylococcus mesophilus]
MTITQRTSILRTLQSGLPQLLAVYAFGSRIRGDARPDSDLDLAVLVAGYADPVVLWELAGELSDAAGCQVDLLDLRAASTVMQYQIVTTGERWWSKDAQAPIYEAAILSEKTALDTARAALLDDVRREGRIYGR